MHRICVALKKQKYLFLLLLPGIVWYFIYRFLPMVGLVIAFKEFSFSKGVFASEWVGLKYFKFIFFQHKDFYRILLNTFLINGYRILFSLPVTHHFSSYAQRKYEIMI
jgi:putative aldouronate transport system permease protein